MEPVWRKGFEYQCKRLDSIPDTSCDLGMVVHSMQTAEASPGYALHAVSMTSLDCDITAGSWCP